MPLPDRERYSSPSEYVDRLINRFRERILADPLAKGRKPDDPYIGLWATILAAGELRAREEANQSYYDAGYCGGCPDCGTEPYPTLPNEYGSLVIERLRGALRRLDDSAEKRDAVA